MAFLVDEETGNITLVQGDSGEYPLTDVPSDKDYVIYFGIYNDKRKPIGYELSENITCSINLYAWTYSTNSVYTDTEEPTTSNVIFDSLGNVLDYPITATTTTTITVTYTSDVYTFYSLEGEEGEEEMVELDPQPDYDAQNNVYTLNGYVLSNISETYEFDSNTYDVFVDIEANRYYRLHTVATTTVTYTRNSDGDTQRHYDVIPTTNVTFDIPASLTDYLTVKNNEEYSTYYFGIKLCDSNGYEDTLLLGNSQIGDLNTITVYPKKLEGTTNG